MLDNNKYQDLIYYNEDALLKLKSGIDKIVNAVKVTLGPYGRNVIFDMEGGPVITKDGVSVSNYIRLIDPIENMAAEILKQVSRKTVDDVGDGTTTSMVLTQAIINNTDVKSVSNINQYKKYLETLRDAIIEFLEDNKTTLELKNEELIKNILFTSSNQDQEVVDKLFESFKLIGLDGLIRINKSKQNATSVVYDSGYRLNRGLISSYFVNSPEDNTTLLSNCLLLIVNERLEQFKLVKPLLESALNSKQALVIVAKDFSEEFLSVCAKNMSLGTVIIPIFAEGYNDDLIKNLEDLALYCDGEVLTTGQLKEGTGRVGAIDEIKISQNYTTIKSTVNKDKVVLKVKQLKNLLTKTDNEISKSKIKDRISRLTSGLATINVGGYTEAEIKEKFDRYEDALGSMQAAIKHGVLPGGGTALYKASMFILSKESLNEDYIHAVECLSKSLMSPYSTILKNADIPNHKLKTTEFNVGYDLMSLTEQDMIVSGVVDPFLVTTSALRNAVSIATMIITTGCIAKNTETILL